MTEFHCRKCNNLIAKKDGNLLSFSGCVMSFPTFNTQQSPLKLTIPCPNDECENTFQFEYPKYCSQKVIAKQPMAVL